MGIKIEEPIPVHLDFYITLENPPSIATSSNAEVVIPDLEDNVAATESIWPIGKSIEERNKKVKDIIQRVMASQSTSHHTLLVTIMDLKRDEMRISLQHASV